MNRKDEHLELALKFHKEIKESDFDDIQFVHNVFSETNVDEVDISTKILGFDFQSPFHINGMTGGSEKTKAYNKLLGELAHHTKIFMGVGSLSIALRDKSTHDSFKIARKMNPNGIIFANLGADKTLEDAKRACEIIDANGIQIHVNIAQEVVMPEGERKFEGWLDNISSIVDGLGLPVMVKEVGFGMSKKAISNLIDRNVTTIDVAGNGGTNFAKIENSRRKNDKYDFLLNYGNSTVNSLMEAQEYINKAEIIASGGIRNSMDIVKSLSLGAKSVAMAGNFINLVHEKGMDEAIITVENWKYQIKSIMALLGAKNLDELTKTDLIIKNNVKNWCKIRNIDYIKLGNRS